MRLKNPSDALAGLIFTGIGLIGLWQAGRLPLGTSLRMGAGYFPTLISATLIGFGILILLRSIVMAGPQIEAFNLRALAFVLTAVAVFAFSLGQLGLIATIVLTVITAGIAGRDSRPLEVGAVAIGLSLFSAVLFVRLLGLPLQPFPEFMVP